MKMNRDELEKFVRTHIQIESSGDIPMNTNIFMALCKICDQDMATIVVNRLSADAKVSTVSCNSCHELNSVLMFHIEIPADYERKNDEATEQE